MRKKKPDAADLYLQYSTTPPPPPKQEPPEPVDTAKLRELLQQCRTNYEAFWSLLRQCELDQEIRDALASAFAGTLHSMLEMIKLKNTHQEQLGGWLLGVAADLVPFARKSSNQRRGPQHKKEVSNERNGIIQLLLEQGFQKGEVHNFMCREHNNLMRKNQKGDYIKEAQMWRGFRESRNG